jgi:Pyruvate/2-oxoacid:ferredoxin oxidoreductase delta subunit
MFNSYVINTLQYDLTKCIGCEICWSVCPHGVFENYQGKARIVHYESCMECGACQMNCPTAAIQVKSGVGCAGAMIRSALRGKDSPSEECC